MYRDDCQHAELPARGELVMHEVHGDRGSDRPEIKDQRPGPPLLTTGRDLPSAPHRRRA